MDKIRVLNLYAGIGGNRKLWPNDKIEVTAVEIEPKIAAIYQDFFPNDKVIVADAHQFLLDHFKEFDFIWSSPPCPSHSRMRNLKNNCEECVKLYPDMKLWQEIIFLKHFCKTKFVVENVISYYEPFIEPQECENHYFWTNFNIAYSNPVKRDIRRHGDNVNPEKWTFNVKETDLDNRMKIKVLNNLVRPELGLHIFNMAFKDKQKDIREFGVGRTAGSTDL